MSIPLEVASEGEGDLAVTIDAAGREFSQRVKVRGHAATAASPTNPELRVTRTLYRLDPVIGPDHAELPEGRWNRLPVAPGEPVTPGTLLLLECRVRSPNALHSLKWRQRMPANCVSLGNDLREIRLPGRTTLARSFALEFEGVGIAAGDTVFEIPMAMVGGGTCVVPIPEVLERTKSLAIESDDLRVSGAAP